MKFDSAKDMVGLDDSKTIVGYIPHKKGCYGSKCQNYGKCAKVRCDGNPKQKLKVLADIPADHG